MIPPGQGENIELTVTAGGQISPPILFHYDRPTVTKIMPKSSPTSGVLPGSTNRTVATIIGTNFGEFNNSDVQVIFTKAKDKVSDPDVVFIAEGQDIVSVENHTTIKFRIPPAMAVKLGVCQNCRTTSETNLAFEYEAPH